MLRKTSPQPTPPRSFDEHGVYHGFPDLAIDGYEFGEVFDRIKRLVARNVGGRIAKLHLEKHPAAAELDATYTRLMGEFRQCIVAFAKAVEAVEQFEREVPSTPTDQS